MNSIPNLKAIRDWCNDKFTLKKASSSELGGIKVGSGLSIAQDGTLSTSGGGGCGASELNDLDDVTVSNPSSGQILKYNSTFSEFRNDGFELDDLSDVDITAPYNYPTGGTHVVKCYIVDTHPRWKNEALVLNELLDVNMDGYELGGSYTRLEYKSSRNKWEPSKGKRCDVLYDSGNLNQYAGTGINIPFAINFPTLDDLVDYDDLAIMIGFTDVTYSNPIFMEVRFNIFPYVNTFTDWKTVLHRVKMPFHFDVDDPSRQIEIGFIRESIESSPYYRYGFNYIVDDTLTTKIPGIRKIYGIKY